MAVQSPQSSARLGSSLTDALKFVLLIGMVFNRIYSFCYLIFSIFDHFILIYVHINVLINDLDCKIVRQLNHESLISKL